MSFARAVVVLAFALLSLTEVRACSLPVADYKGKNAIFIDGGDDSNRMLSYSTADFDDVIVIKNNEDLLQLLTEISNIAECTQGIRHIFYAHHGSAAGDDAPSASLMDTSKIKLAKKGKTLTPNSLKARFPHMAYIPVLLKAALMFKPSPVVILSVCNEEGGGSSSTVNPWLPSPQHEGDPEFWYKKRGCSAARVLDVDLFPKPQLKIVDKYFVIDRADRPDFITKMEKRDYVRGYLSLEKMMNLYPDILGKPEKSTLHSAKKDKRETPGTALPDEEAGIDALVVNTLPPVKKAKSNLFGRDKKRKSDDLLEPKEKKKEKKKDEKLRKRKGTKKTADTDLV